MENVLQRQGKIKVEGATLTETEDKGAMAKAEVKLRKTEMFLRQLHVLEIIRGNL